MRKVERFLISILWASAVLLVALWFFNTTFGFNLFLSAHWRYLSELQLSGKVDILFYISFAATIFIGLAGLYVLIVPWHRKITLSGAPAAIVTETQTVPEQSAAVDAQQNSPFIAARPPKLNLTTAFVPSVRENFVPMAQSAPVANAISSTIDSTSNNPMIQGIKDRLSEAGFVMKKSVRFGNVTPDFVAIGTDEALIIGLFSDVGGEIVAQEGGDSLWASSGRSLKSPVWQLSSIVQKFQTLFLQTVGADLQIHILPFVFIVGSITNRKVVEPVWDALGIKVFDNEEGFSKFISEHSPREIEDDEKETFDAFSDLVDSALQYFSEA